MNCVNHPVRQGVNTCSKCGSWLCDECSVDIEGRVLCKGCIAKMAGHHPHHGRPEHRGSVGHKPNVLLTMMFSCLPGLNYMYLGLIKRGLFIMSMFFLATYLCGFINMFGFAIPVIIATSFFDGLRVRRRILAGECVNDTIDDIKVFVADNKSAIMTAGVVVLALSALSGVSSMLTWTFGWGMHRHSGMIAVALILLGIYFFSKSKKKAPARPEEYKDYRDEQ